MATYEVEFEQGGKTMILDVEGDRPPTEQEATGLIQQHLSQGQGRRTPEGRPVIQNPDGSVSTEETITVTEPQINQGRATNIPTIYGGVRVPEADAIQRIIKSGGMDPDTGNALAGYDSIDQAVQAAQQRTQQLGQTLSEPEPQPSTPYQEGAPAPAAAPMPQAAAPAQAETGIGPMAYGAVQGLADIAGGIPDLLVAGAEKGLSYLPDAIANPIRALTYGQETVEAPPVRQQMERTAKHLLSKVGVPAEDLDPDTRMEQFVQRVVREVTGTVVALPAVRALSATARAASVGGEIAMGTAQGVGAGLAQQVFPGSVTAEIAGQLAPNAAGLTRALAKNLGTRLVPDPDMLRAQVTNALRETTGDMAVAEQNLQRTLATQGAVPGLQPTLAEATGAPGLLALQRSQRAADPALASRLADRRMQNIDATTDTLDELFKGGDIDDVRGSLAGTQKRVQQRLQQRTETAQQRLATVQESAEARAVRSQARINERVTRAQGQIRDKTAQLVKGGDVDALDAQEIASMETRRLYEDARKTFRTESRRMYENVDPEDAVTGPVGQLYDQADEIARRGMLAFDQRDLPASLRDFDRSVKARATQPVRPKQMGLDEATVGMRPDDQLELQQFIRRQGGINLGAETDLGSEFEALVRNRETGTTGLFRKTGGLTPAQMAERAQEAGFTFEADKFELLDAIRESMKSGKTYSVRNSTAFGDPIDEAYMGADAAMVDPADLRDVDVSLTDLQSLRSHIMRDARSQTGPDAGNKRRLLNQFRQSVESRMESMAREQGRPDVMERLQSANRFYRQNINKFSTGAGERILRQRNGVYGTSNAHVIREFLKTPEDAAQFVDGIGNRESALEAIEQYLDADLYIKAVTEETGRLSVPKVQKFLRDRHPMMRMFPELRERYQDMAQIERKAQVTEDAAKRISQRATRRVSESEELIEAQERAAMAQASVQAQQQRLAREPGQALLKAELDNGGIAQIMGRSDSNRQLIRLADTMRDNPEARQGIARSMWTEFLRREGQRAGRDPITDNPLLNDKQLSNFLARYGSTLNHLYGAEHVASLRKVAEGLRVSRLADRRPPGQVGSDTAELLQGQSAFMQGAARTAFPISMPLGSLKLRLLRFAGRSALNYIHSKKEEALRTITQEILYDPDISKTFAMLREPQTAQKAGVRLKAHMLMLGAENRFDDPEGEE